MTETAPRRNRVDPFGDLHSVRERGMFTGNRGCLVDDTGLIVRHHRGNLWIACVLTYKDWQSPLEQPGHWTPLFFLDDAVVLAAGHRPCGLCRRDDYREYRDAVQRARQLSRPPSASDLNRNLAGERLNPGRGLRRAAHRKTWTAPPDTLPDGTVILDPQYRRPRLLVGAKAYEFGFGGWSRPTPRPGIGSIEVLTPPTSVAALAAGFRPVLHPSARTQSSPAD